MLTDEQTDRRMDKFMQNMHRLMELNNIAIYVNWPRSMKFIICWTTNCKFQTLTLISDIYLLDSDLVHARHTTLWNWT
jgi:hypothetical protein